MPVWDDLLTEDERKVFEVFRQPKTLGTRPAILVIDVNYAFVGRKPENIVASVQDYRTSCGERGWEGVANLQTFLAVGRKVGVPIIYTTGTTRSRRGTSWAIIPASSGAPSHMPCPRISRAAACSTSAATPASTAPK